jgi:hypothetical protein
MRLRGLIASVVFAALASVGLLTGATTAASATAPPPAWGLRDHSPGSASGIHPESWISTVCEGEFTTPEAIKGYLYWGGETSCTSTVHQSLTVILYNVKVDPVDEDDNAGGQQIYVHAKTYCQSSTETSYRVRAYSIINGVQAQPYPAVSKEFTVPCFIPYEPGCDDAAASAPPAISSAPVPAASAATTRRRSSVQPNC